MNNLSIKQKLLIFNVIIQVIILVILSVSIYKTLHISTLDKMETSLKVIILDIVDDLGDVLEHKVKLKDVVFDEEFEYKFKPLYIRLINKQTKEINTKDFPKNFPLEIDKKDINTIHFKEFENYVMGEIHFFSFDNEYILQVATDYKLLNETMENLFYILVFLVPIVLIFAIAGGYILIYKSLSPMENILANLKDINSSTLSKRLEVFENNDEITELSKEINSLLERLEVSFEKINQFSSDASHELKTPLTIIRGEMEIALRKDRDKSQYKKSLEICLDEVLIIQQTIDDLLYLAKDKENKADRNQIIYTDELILQAVSELKSFARLKNIDIKTNIELLPNVDGHNDLIKIAIKNILKNAIIYSYENSVVEIKNYESNGYIVISIIDKGIGISKKDQEKIFEKFYRTDKSRNKESGGTGLGMSIVEKIIKQHNGKIELISEEKVGTTVNILFRKGTNV